MKIRALVVDDHEPWRRYAALAVEASLDATVVGEAADGAQAVAEATRLRPDLVVIDVGMPAMNGLEAAQRILAELPAACLVFLSENPSADTADAAIALGASAYVMKSDAAFELCPALRRAIEGRLFVAGRLVAHVGANGAGARLNQGARCHEAALCPDRRGLVDAYTRFLESALRIGSSALLLSRGHTRDEVDDRLRRAGVDLGGAIAEGRYVVVDPQLVIDTVLLNGAIDERAFWNLAVPLVTRALRSSRGGAPRIAACGAIAPVLWRQGHTEASIRVEQLVDDLARRYDIDVLCGYALDEGPADDDGRVLAHVHTAHSLVYAR
jgi:DNA-binding NarL/FixJ family response regulator